MISWSRPSASFPVAFYARDVDAHYAKARERAASVESEPKDQPYGQRESVLGTLGAPMVVRQPVEITSGVACKGGRGAKTGPDLPPKKWTGLGRHIDGMDWSKCPDAESVPDRCSGQWVVKDTRVLVQGIIDNADDFTAEEIALRGITFVCVTKRIAA